VIRSLVVSSLLCLLFLYAQTTWLQAIAMLGVVPDLALITLVYVSFRNVGMEGMALGFASGIAQDVLSAAPLGLNALVRTLVGFVFGLASGKVYADRLLFPVMLSAGATLLKALSIGGIALIFPRHIAAYDLLASKLWIEIAYNALVAPILFLLFSALGPLLVTPRRGR
jgi:rod shape-determining protein MreD